MKRQRPSQPASRDRPARPTRHQNAQGFTLQQVFILVLVALLGGAALILAAFVLLSGPPAGQSASPVSQAGSGGPELPLTWTPPPANAAPRASTSSPAQPLPSPPASCAQAGSGYSQGTVTRVVDGSTLEVQVDGNTLHIGYAGIAAPEESGGLAEQIDKLAAQKARELLDGQAVILVKDVSEQDASGRLVRYVFSGGRFLNLELVRQGLATVSTNTPDQACRDTLEQAQQQARVEHLGVWEPAPVPTSTFVPLVTLDPSKYAGCDCSIRYECSDFKTHAEAQTCFNACNDYSSKLDDDRDGIACENLP